MIFKIIPIFILLTFACAFPAKNNYVNDNGSQNYYSGAAQQYQESSPESYKSEEEKYESAFPKYEFKYAVNDEHSGDSKSQHEVRDGDKVQGVYTLTDSDGFQRIVEYTADDKDGFVAVVRREPIAGYKPAQQNQENGYQQNESYSTRRQPAQQSKQQFESFTDRPQSVQYQANIQQQFESYSVKPQVRQPSPAPQHQDLEGFAAKPQVNQHIQISNQPQFESYSVKPQREQQRQEYNPVRIQTDVQTTPQTYTGYDRTQDGKYFIKYSTSTPEQVTRFPEHKYKYVAPMLRKPEHKYQYVAPVSENKFVESSSPRTTHNEKVAVSHVNNYFETPKSEDESASEYNYGYDY